MDASTPAPHTFILYLKSGGSAFFSKQCQEELIKAKMNPDWFGDYDYVAKKNKDARDKCKNWRDKDAAWRKANPDQMPTAEDRYLASCQSGHLCRDSNFRNEGQRGDVCGNVVDGFESNRAPCIPQSGRATDPSGEHGQHTINENNDSARQAASNTPGTPPQPGGPYPEANRQRDEDNRTQPHLNHHQKEFPNRSQPTGSGDPTGPNATAAASGTGTSADARAVGAKDPSEPKCAPNQVVDGKTAADCINNWRKKAEAAMKQKCKDEAEANKLESDPDPFKTRDEKYNDMKARAAKATGARRTELEHEAGAYKRAWCRYEQGSRIGTPQQRTSGRAA